MSSARGERSGGGERGAECVFFALIPSLPPHHHSRPLLLDTPTNVEPTGELQTAVAGGDDRLFACACTYGKVEERVDARPTPDHPRPALPSLPVSLPHLTPPSSLSRHAPCPGPLPPSDTATPTKASRAAGAGAAAAAAAAATTPLPQHGPGLPPGWGAGDDEAAPAAPRSAGRRGHPSSSGPRRCVLLDPPAGVRGREAGAEAGGAAGASLPPNTDLAAAVASFVAAAAARGGGVKEEEEGEEDEEDEEDEEEESAGGRRRRSAKQPPPPPPSSARGPAPVPTLPAVAALDAALRRAAAPGGGGLAGPASVSPTANQSDAPLARAARSLEAAARVGARVVVREGDAREGGRGRAALLSLASATALLRLAAAPGCPAAARSEDALCAAMASLRHHLLANVLAPRDARLAASHRPPEDEKEDEKEGGAAAEPAPPGPGPAAKRAAKAAAKAAASARARAADEGALAGLRAGVEVALPLAAAAAAAVRLPDRGALPLLRAAADGLTLDASPGVGGSPALAPTQAACVELLAAGFRHCPGLRLPLVEAVTAGALPHLPSARGPGRAVRTFTAGMGGGGGGAPEAWEGGEGGGAPAADAGAVLVQPAAAAFLAMLQAAADLPEEGLDQPAGTLACAAAALQWADVGWAAILDRAAGAKALKADSAVDLRSAAASLVGDCAALLPLPGWPASGPALLRLAACLAGARGLRASDTAVRCAAVDLLGTAAGAVCAVGAAADGGAGSVAAGVLGALSSPTAPLADLPGLAPEPRLLALFLADPTVAGGAAGGGCGAAGRAGARRFLLVRALAEWGAGAGAAAAAAAAATGGGGAVGEAEAEAAAEAALAYRAAAAALDAGGASIDLTPAEAGALAVAGAAAGAPGKARAALLQALLDCCDPAAQAPSARARGLRALGCAVRADPRVARLPDVQAGVARALRDEAASVRQQAVDVLGSTLDASPALAAALFEVVALAARDGAASVKKAALRILETHCLRSPSFPRQADAGVAVMAAAVDAESEGVADVAARALGEVWFGGGGGGTNSPPSPSALARARLLAETAAAAYAASGPGARLPLDPTHPLACAVRAALDAARGGGGGGGLGAPLPSSSSRPGTPSKKGAGGGGSRPASAAGKGRAASAGDGGASNAPGADVARALLELAVTGGGSASGSGNNGPLASSSSADPALAAAALLALHALTVADPALASPADDPGSLVRALAPYAKAGAKPSGAGGDAARAAAERSDAERTVAALTVLATALSTPRAGPAAAATAVELAKDLAALINAHPYTAVVAGACRALAALAALAPPAQKTLGHWAGQYLLKLSGRPTTHTPFTGRFLFILGHLWRYGADAIEREGGGGAAARPLSLADVGGTAPPATPRPTTAAALAAALAYATDAVSPPKVREAALHCLGCLALARPATMMDGAARGVLAGALGRGAPPALKLRALHNLTDLLRAEEGRLVAAQKEGDAAGPASTAPPAPSASSAGGEGGGGPGTAAAVPAVCGEGDSLALASAVIQDAWDGVRSLALDPSPVPPAPLASGPGDPVHSAVRRAAVGLMDAVDRGGLVAPWTAVPTLVASSTDPAPDVAAAALAILRRVATKQADMFRSCVADGLPLAAAFQAGLADAFPVPGGGHQPHAGAPTPASASLDAASAAVARGVGALYADLIQPVRPTRHAFLGRLLRKFDAACDVHAQGGAGADVRLLAAAAAAAAALPVRRADEPLALIRAADDVLARRGDAVRAALRRVLRARAVSRGEAPGEASDEEEEEGGGGSGGAAAAPAASVPPPRAEAASALAAIMLCLLRRHLVTAYALTPDRVHGFATGAAERRRAEERAAVVQGGGGAAFLVLGLGAELPPAALAPRCPPPDDEAWWGVGEAALEALTRLLAEQAAEAAAAGPALPDGGLATPAGSGGGTGDGSGDLASPVSGRSPAGPPGGRKRSAAGGAAGAAAKKARAASAGGGGRGSGGRGARGRDGAARGRARGRGGRAAKRCRGGSSSSGEDEPSSSSEEEDESE